MSLVRTPRIINKLLLVSYFLQNFKSILEGAEPKGNYHMNHGCQKCFAWFVLWGVAHHEKSRENVN